MELLQRIPYPRRLAARVWLLTAPSALLSFERRQHIPKLPIGRGRLLGPLILALGVAVVLRSPTSPFGERTHYLHRFQEKPAVAGGLLALTGVGVLLRSLALIAYALGLAFAFTREAIDLEEPQLPGRGGEDDSWDYEETSV